MKKTILLTFGVMLMAMAAFAGTYTIYTTPGQDAILNEASAFYGFPVQAIIENYKLQAIADLIPKMAKEKKKSFLIKYDSLSAIEKAKIDAVFTPIMNNATTVR